MNTIPKDLLLAKEAVYDPCGFKVTDIKTEPESAAYGACTFKLNSFSIVYRIAKITPTKIGQFVTIWKRKEGGPTQPFDSSDALDFIIISTRSNGFFGQFIFPKKMLIEKGILSHTKEGKRGIRVYPPWDKALNKQAQKTQQWQLAYFLEIPLEGPINLNLAQQLIKL